MTAPNLLNPLRQVSGVTGSFVTDLVGMPLIRDPGVTLPPATLHAIGQRFTSLLAAGAEGVPGAVELFLRGESGALYVRRIAQGFLAVVCGESCVVSRLRGVAQTTARTLDATNLRSIRPTAPAKPSTRTGIWG
jgi:hypothetical protein